MTTYVSRLGASVPFYGIVTGNYVVKISGVQYLCIAGTLKLDLSVGRRSQATFQLYTDTFTHFQQYQPVTIFDQNGALVFSGYISNPKEQKPGYQNSLVQCITAIDQHFLADKRIIAKSYTGMTCGAIVADIVKNYLAEEGVTLSAIFDGLIPSTTLYPGSNVDPNGNVGVISSVVFSYCTVAAALDALVTEASTAGIPYYWMIDQNKKLWFQPYTGVTNNTVIDGSFIDQKGTPCTVQRQNPKYRNIEYLTGGVNQTPVRNETFKGDGNTKSWTLGYPVFSKPTISLQTAGLGNPVQQNVGLKGVDDTGSGGTSYQYYWSPGDATITQDSSLAPLSNNPQDTLYVSYIGQYPSVVVVPNPTAIAAQKAIDGTSGKIEAVDEDKALVELNSAFIEASRFLTRYGVPGTQLQFTTTFNSGFMPGQLLTVNLPAHGINNQQMLIETVSIADLDQLNIWYTVTAVQGPYDTTWVSFFSQLFVSKQPATAISVGTSTTNPPVVTVATQTTASFVANLVTAQATLSPVTSASNTVADFTSSVTLQALFTPTFAAGTLAQITASLATPTASFTGTSTASSTNTKLLKMYSFSDNANSDPYNLAANKYCAGTNVLLYWTQLEPHTENVFDWTPLENVLNHWASHGKKCIVRVSVSGQKDWNSPISQQGTPDWVFNSGVTKIISGANSAVILPQYWNGTFQTKLKGFITALANKYDGDSRIAGFQVAVGMGGECKADSYKYSSDQTKDKAAKFALMSKYGYTDALWFLYIKFVLDTYVGAFTKSQLMMASDTDVIGSTPGYSQDTTIGYITAYKGKIWIQNDGLVVNQSIRKSLQAAFDSGIPCVSEQRNPTTGSNASGDTIKQDLDIAKTQATSGIFLVFQQDINANATNTLFDQYVQTF